MPYEYPKFEYRRNADQDAKVPVRHPVVIAGAGPVGLALAVDLALKQVPVILLEAQDTISVGSRAICFAKRTLEVCERLGLGRRLLEKGVTWKKGVVFFGDDEVFEFDLLPEEGHQFPAFINLQQYYLELYAIERAQELREFIDLRWCSELQAIDSGENGVRLTVGTPDGAYQLDCDWLIAADGARSFCRKSLGLEFEGRTFDDQFLIADIKTKADMPPVRRFWFAPTFTDADSALLHMQPDDVWRLDFQIGPEADAAEEMQIENVMRRVRGMLGDEIEPDLEWISVYRFQSRCIRNFVHGRVIFTGDAAHQVSPFGARGANSGIQDAENLAWKLQLVLKELAPESLLDSYNAERTYAAEENIRHSTQSTDFIAPKGVVSLAYRNAVLSLAKQYKFARPLINSGRLSTPTIHRESMLNTADVDSWSGKLMPGAPAADAPLQSPEGESWLLSQLKGEFTLLYFTEDAVPELVEAELRSLSQNLVPVKPLLIGLKPESQGVSVFDLQGLAALRYDARNGTTYLLRPDQHICARWKTFSLDEIRSALNTATCN